MSSASEARLDDYMTIAEVSAPENPASYSVDEEAFARNESLTSETLKSSMLEVMGKLEARKSETGNDFFEKVGTGDAQVLILRQPLHREASIQAVDGTMINGKQDLFIAVTTQGFVGVSFFHHPESAFDFQNTASTGAELTFNMMLEERKADRSLISGLNLPETDNPDQIDIYSGFSVDSKGNRTLTIGSLNRAKFGGIGVFRVSEDFDGSKSGLMEVTSRQVEDALKSSVEAGKHPEKDVTKEYIASQLAMANEISALL